MSHQAREHLILDIVRTRTIQTQDDLVAALADRGCVVNQGTVSRDIQRLGLVKVPVATGGHRYVPPADLDPGPPVATTIALRDAAAAIVSVGDGAALLVVRTLPGRAGLVALSIDEARLAGVVGTVAGDDTVLVVLADAAARDGVRTFLEQAVRGTVRPG
jgi:transcriptional regulator of arginine metabolism